MSVKLQMMMVSSLDGVISRDDDESVSAWSSLEDQKQFKARVGSSQAVILGRKSFTEKVADIPYYVLSRGRTSTSEELAAGVFYTHQSPEEIVKMLNNKDYTDILLLGGATVNHLFLEHNLVDEIRLTVEPKLFGEGKRVLSRQLARNLELMTSEVLNPRGTLLLTYKVLKN